MAPSAGPREVGGYRLLRVLGSGGMGTVYEAQDGAGRLVALKLLHPSFAADDDARLRMRREVATLHRVRGARVAQVLDAELDSAEAFLVTELIDGQALDESIAQHGVMDVDELATLAEGLAAALRDIHAVGVVHRDLKPGNVMLTDDGPVVIDFGISQDLADARLTRTGLVTGTPGYVDPTVLAGGHPDQGGDWWGWAAVLVHAATGRAPFGTGPISAVLARVETGRADLDGLDRELAAVLGRALAPRPTDRLRPDAVMAALRDLARGRGLDPALLVGAPPAPPSPEPYPAHPAPSYPVFRPDGVQQPVARPSAQVPPAGAPQAPATVVPVRPAAQQYSPPPTPAVRPATVAPGTPPPRWPVQQGLPPAGPATSALPGTRVMPADGGRAVAPSGQVLPPGFPGAQPTHAPGGVAAWPEWARPATSRPGITAAWWIGLTALAGVAPGVALLVLVLVLVAGGAVGTGARALRNRRLRHGVRRSDAAWAGAGTPAHLVMGVLLAVPGLLVGVLAGAIVWGLLAKGLPGHVVSILTVGVTGLLAWWTPSSHTAREGTWRILGWVAPSKGATALWIGLGLVIAAVAAVLIVGGAAPDWTPFPTPPVPSF